ncbi:MAG: glycosyltransferase family 4 protein [Candidatus Omnitrophota bacterium]|nr:MAG: glycosyltransferase family 4 protein [Candidatus Omnitrophota bacterium]
MKIAVIAPPWIPVPPPKYGGTELVIYNLVEGLTELGQEVILFAAKDSKVSCRLMPYIESEYYFGLDSEDRTKAFVTELIAKYAFSRAGYEGVDIIHCHTMDIPLADIPVIYTIHGPANEPSVVRCEELSKNPKNNFVSISKRQKELYLMLNKNIRFADTVYNCINAKPIEWKKKKEDFFLFVGRVNWEKGLDLAIRVASKAGVNLIMAVKMTEQFEKEFFRKEILPWIEKYPQHLFFQFQKELPRHMIFDLLRRARCTLFTSQWEEPFGLVMLESLACGTPVIALRRGAAPEVIIDGKTGYCVDTEDDMVSVIKEGKLDKIKPETCRKYVEKNFSRESMARNYLNIYKKSLQR